MFGVERCDLRRKGVAVLPEAIGVAAGLAVLPLGKWGLRHECTQTRVIGFVGQLDQLFLGDGKVVAKRAIEMGYEDIEVPLPALLSVGEATRCLRAGHVIAYPTEAVYGLGCDPSNEAAVRRVMTLTASS